MSLSSSIRMQSALRTARMLVHVSAAVVLACTYFAFRVELFDEEVEAQAHDFPAGLALTAPTLSWETFDKENAPQAFTIRVRTSFEISFGIAPAPEFAGQYLLPYQPVRDKSPPMFVSTL